MNYKLHLTFPWFSLENKKATLKAHCIHGLWVQAVYNLGLSLPQALLQSQLSHQFSVIHCLALTCEQRQLPTTEDQTYWELVETDIQNESNSIHYAEHLLIKKILFLITF